MLDRNSSQRSHQLQNLTLILLSLLFLPLDTLVLATCILRNQYFISDVLQSRKRNQRHESFNPRTILVTGVGMTKGLALARLFYEAGHNVIGADFQADGAIACGRFSRSIHSFYTLRKPSPKHGSSDYIQSLLNVILKEKVDLWVSCSGVASAVEDGEAKEIIEARTSCKAVQFDLNMTQKLHEKHTFIEYVDSLGLQIPETHIVTSREAVKAVLYESPPGRQYVMKTIGVVDAVRADMTLLPRKSPKETSRHLASLPISEDVPWIIQKYISGSEYCTHSLVVRGQVKAFVACPSSELLMHYEALEHNSALSQEMLKFTEIIAKAAGESFTGHLSFDFLVPNADAEIETLELYPIECNPRAHTAVALFNHTTAMIDAYISLLDTEPAHPHPQAPVFLIEKTKYYWIGHDFIANFLVPTYHFSLGRSATQDLFESYVDFFTHLSSWRDGTFEIWDPVPWWWLYHAYWPIRFYTCLKEGRQWSRVNVSTTKMFEC